MISDDREVGCSQSKNSPGVRKSRKRQHEERETGGQQTEEAAGTEQGEARRQQTEEAAGTEQGEARRQQTGEAGTEQEERGEEQTGEAGIEQGERGEEQTGEAGIEQGERGEEQTGEAGIEQGERGEEQTGEAGIEQGETGGNTEGEEANTTKPNQHDPKLLHKQVLKDRTLTFQKVWYDRYPWLHFQTGTDGILCFHCSKYFKSGKPVQAKSIDTAFVSSGFKNWKKALERFSMA